MNNRSKAAVEVLEIVKYLDADLLKIINQKYLEELELIKDKDYVFTINKDIPIYDNEFMSETLEMLKELFVTNN